MRRSWCVGLAQLLGLGPQLLGLGPQRRRQPAALGHVAGGTARTDELALGVHDRRRADQHVDDGAVLLDPLRLDLARLRWRAVGSLRNAVRLAGVSRQVYGWPISVSRG